VGQEIEDINSSQGHALITGVPFWEDDHKGAEDMASDLRDISRRLDRQRRTRP
jgi:hypothetical protein